MKRYIFLVFTISILALITACKDEPKKKAGVAYQTLKNGSKYVLDSNNIKLQWTGYKTTKKTPVSGTFNQINLINANPATSIAEVFEGLQFSIPVSSVFSNLEDRDSKLKKLFFGIMKNTELIAGTIHIDTFEKSIISLKMNDKIHDLPMTYTIDKNQITFNGKMNLEDWDAMQALASIHEACLDLHKGDDGVSKTWNEFAIKVSANLNQLVN